MVSDSRIDRATTGSYHARYLSIGAQVTGRVYVAGDYSSSLAIIRFARSSGVVIETRPRTVRWSGNLNANLSRSLGLVAVAERTTDESYKDVRLLAGLTYRIR
jgi:hypothetical protein